MTNSGHNYLEWNGKGASAEVSTAHQDDQRVVATGSRYKAGAVNNASSTTSNLDSSFYYALYNPQSSEHSTEQEGGTNDRDCDDNVSPEVFPFCESDDVVVSHAERQFSADHGCALAFVQILPCAMPNPPLLDTPRTIVTVKLDENDPGNSEYFKKGYCWQRTNAQEDWINFELWEQRGLEERWRSEFSSAPYKVGRNSFGVQLVCDVLAMKCWPVDCPAKESQLRRLTAKRDVYKAGGKHTKRAYIDGNPNGRTVDGFALQSNKHQQLNNVVENQSSVGCASEQREPTKSQIIRSSRDAAQYLNARQEGREQPIPCHEKDSDCQVPNETMECSQVKDPCLWEWSREISSEQYSFQRLKGPVQAKTIHTGQIAFTTGESGPPSMSSLHKQERSPAQLRHYRTHATHYLQYQIVVSNMNEDDDKGEPHQFRIRALVDVFRQAQGSLRLDVMGTYRKSFTSNSALDRLGNLHLPIWVIQHEGEILLGFGELDGMPSTKLPATSLARNSSAPLPADRPDPFGLDNVKKTELNAPISEMFDHLNVLLVLRDKSPLRGMQRVVVSSRATESVFRGFHFREATYHPIVLAKTVLVSVADSESTKEQSNVQDPYRWINAWKSALSLPPSIERYAKLDQIMTDFTAAATAYAKVIILERYIPNHQKTIKVAEAGGVAGGIKFESHSIMFKFAIDHKGIYNGEEGATKAANADLLGAIALLNASEQLVREEQSKLSSRGESPGKNSPLDLGLPIPPLICLIDFLGARVVAMSKLPITDKTLVYGSSNAGVSVFNSSAGFSNSMSRIAKRLNLARHRVGDPRVALAGGGVPHHDDESAGEATVELCVGSDVEGHEAADGSRYVVDCGRLMPPEDPTKYSSDHPASFLVNHLRPRLVRENDVPLSSDAFSGFGWHNAAYHNAQVRTTTEKLQQVVLPRVVRYLLDPSNVPNLTPSDLTVHLHNAGVNMRQLGHLWRIINSTVVALTDKAHRDMVLETILIEMIARTCKQNIRATMRRYMIANPMAAESGFHSIVVRHFNKVLTRDTIVFRDMWRDAGDLRRDLRTRFGFPHHRVLVPRFRTIGGPANRGSFKADVSRSRLFTRLTEIVGVTIDAQASNALQWNDSPRFFNREVLNAFEIVQLRVMVKMMPTSPSCQGSLCFLRATSGTLSMEESCTLLDQAIVRFHQALTISPDSYDVVANLANALHQRAVRTDSPNLRERCVQQAAQFYQSIVTTRAMRESLKLFRQAFRTSFRQSASWHHDSLKVYRNWDTCRYLTLQEHDATVTAIAVSDCGSRCVTGSKDGALILWQLEVAGNTSTVLHRHWFAGRVNQVCIHDGVYGGISLNVITSRDAVSPSTSTLACWEPVHGKAFGKQVVMEWVHLWTAFAVSPELMIAAAATLFKQVELACLRTGTRLAQICLPLHNAVSLKWIDIPGQHTGGSEPIFSAPNKSDTSDHPGVLVQGECCDVKAVGKCCNMKLEGKSCDVKAEDESCNTQVQSKQCNVKTEDECCNTKAVDENSRTLNLSEVTYHSSTERSDSKVNIAMATNENMYAQQPNGTEGSGTRSLHQWLVIGVRSGQVLGLSPAQLNTLRLHSNESEAGHHNCGMSQLGKPQEGMNSPKRLNVGKSTMVQNRPPNLLWPDDIHVVAPKLGQSFPGEDEWVGVITKLGRIESQGMSHGNVDVLAAVSEICREVHDSDVRVEVVKLRKALAGIPSAIKAKSQMLEDATLLPHEIRKEQHRLLKLFIDNVLAKPSQGETYPFFFPVHDSSTGSDKQHRSESQDTDDDSASIESTWSEEFHETRCVNAFQVVCLNAESHRLHVHQYSLPVAGKLRCANNSNVRSLPDLRGDDDSQLASGGLSGLPFGNFAGRGRRTMFAAMDALGRYLVTDGCGAKKRSLRVWDWGTGRLIKVLSPPSRKVSMSGSADLTSTVLRDHLVSGSSTEGSVAGQQGGLVANGLSVENFDVRECAVSPSGVIVCAGGRSHVVHVWVPGVEVYN